MNSETLQISIYAVETKYPSKTGDVIVYMTDISKLINFLEQRYYLTPREIKREVWSVELYIKGEDEDEGQWVRSIRIYHGAKDIRDFDLYAIPGKRRNAYLVISD